jgi:PadR family transcriptional regulator PadR
MGTAVLACLETADLHGYAIAERLGERGFGRPKGGSLYPLLGALEANGAIEAAWVPGERGPGRRSYALTASGRAQLADEREGWGRLVAALDPEPCHEGVVAG